MTDTLAQGLQFQVGGSTSGTPSLVSVKGPLVGINNISDIVTVLMSFLYPFAGVILLFVLVWGGFDLINSHGESDKISGARAKITAGIIGFVLLAASYILARVLGFIFGVGEGVL